MAMLDPDRCYRALASRDRRFDGRFFVGVSTTGIYCRPVCPAKLPRPERCAYFISAAAAEGAGFRPCLRCRPELAPGLAAVDATGALAQAAARRIAAGALNGRSVEALAEDLGSGARQVRRALRREYGVSPVALAQTHRLLLAKQLLTDSALPIIDVAYASGFTSLGRFNTLFRSRYGLAPSEFRRPAMQEADAPIVLALPYRAPYAWEALLEFLAARATPGIELIAGGVYRRTIAVGTHRGTIAVGPPNPERLTLRIAVSQSLAPALMPLLARLKSAFDLDADPGLIQADLGSDPLLGPLVARWPGLRIPGCCDGFELAVRAILGQQVSVAGATTLAGRFAAAFGEPFDTGVAGLTTLTPTAERIAAAGVEAVAQIGLPKARAASIVAVAQAVAGGSLRLEPGCDAERTIATLEALPGIGPWTAQYIALRALAWPDAFPHGDLGLLKATGLNARQLLERAESWRPWRGYSVLYLWRSLGAKQEDQR